MRAGQKGLDRGRMEATLSVCYGLKTSPYLGSVSAFKIWSIVFCFFLYIEGISVNIGWCINSVGLEGGREGDSGVTFRASCWLMIDPKQKYKYTQIQMYKNTRGRMTVGLVTVTVTIDPKQQKYKKQIYKCTKIQARGRGTAGSR